MLRKNVNCLAPRLSAKLVGRQVIDEAAPAAAASMKILSVNGEQGFHFPAYPDLGAARGGQRIPDVRSHVEDLLVRKPCLAHDPHDVIGIEGHHVLAADGHHASARARASCQADHHDKKEQRGGPKSKYLQESHRLFITLAGPANAVPQKVPKLRPNQLDCRLVGWFGGR